MILVDTIPYLGLKYDATSFFLDYSKGGESIGLNIFVAVQLINFLNHFLFFTVVGGFWVVRIDKVHIVYLNHPICLVIFYKIWAKIVC